VRSEVEEVLARTPPPRARAGTALSLALIDGKRLYTVTFGDTSVFRVRSGGRWRRVGRSTAFLGHPHPTAEVHRARLRAGEWVLVASDGLTDFLGLNGSDAVSSAHDLPSNPAEGVRSLVNRAFAAGSADHIAVALHAPSRTR
jgi:serine/threonine protein phosphatase PrpC